MFNSKLLNYYSYICHIYQKSQNSATFFSQRFTRARTGAPGPTYLNSLRFGIGSWLSSHLPPLFEPKSPKPTIFADLKWLEYETFGKTPLKIHKITRSLCFLVHFLETPIALLVNHVKSAMSFSHWLMKTEGLVKSPMVCVERAVKEKKHATTFIWVL